MCFNTNTVEEASQITSHCQHERRIEYISESYSGFDERVGSSLLIR
jgi:hypothetical protein